MVDIVWADKVHNFCGIEYFENLAMVRSGYWKVFWEIEIPKMSRNTETLQIRDKFFENT